MHPGVVCSLSCSHQRLTPIVPPCPFVSETPPLFFPLRTVSSSLRGFLSVRLSGQNFGLLLLFSHTRFFPCTATPFERFASLLHFFQGPGPWRFLTKQAAFSFAGITLLPPFGADSAFPAFPVVDFTLHPKPLSSFFQRATTPKSGALLAPLYLYYRN